MNDRIQELARQAGLTTVADVYLMKKYMPNEVKFAELIVRDCIQAIQNESKDSSDELEYGLRIAEGAILDHFGVEE